ncbi:MAG: hypothetical protein CSA95_05040 [Bacteroidetes bacterium]|nr:MAG: hypothetical protein CSA95_05040 [Bacteroidota bacterium]
MLNIAELFIGEGNSPYIMQRKFITNLILLLFLNLLVKPFWIFGIDRVVQNTVGATEYGFYSAIFNFTFLFSFFLDFGISNFNNRNIAQNSQLLNKHFSSIILMKLMLGFGYFLLVLISGLIIGYDKPRHLSFIGFMAFNHFLRSFIIYLRSNISGLLMFKTDSFISVLDRVLMIFICGMLLWGHVTERPFQIEWFIYSQTVAYLVTAVVAFGVVVKKAAFQRLRWNKPFFLIIFRQSLPFALLALLMSFYNRIDSVMLERLLPKDMGALQAGIYAHSFRLLDAGNVIPYLFSVLLLPLFSRMIKQREDVTELIKLSFTMLIIISVTVVVSCFFFNYEMINLLYNSHIEESAGIFKVLMTGFVAISTSYVFGTLLTANGSLKALNIIAATGMVINLSLNFFLIPRYHALGSAYAGVVTQFLIVISQIVVVTRKFSLRPPLSYLIRLTLFIVIMWGAGFLFSSMVPVWYYGFVATLVMAVFLAAVLRLLNIRGLLRLFKFKESME